MMRLSQAKHDRRGVATVELAVLLPLIFVLLIGMLELGRAIMVRETLTIAARKGCRTGIVPGNGSSSIVADVNTVLQDNDIDPNLATVTILVNDVSSDPSAARLGDKVTVQVSIDYSTTSWVGGFYLANGTLGSEIVSMMKY